MLLTLTAINFVHVNGGSPYIVDWRIVVVEGRNVPHHVKREEELSGRGNVRGEHVRGICPGKCRDPVLGCGNILRMGRVDLIKQIG